MNLGQITNTHNKYSTNCDYIQFDICGLDKDSSLEKLNKLLKSNPHISSIILHSDWTKKGFSENNFPIRINDYIEIYKVLSEKIKVIGITLHPMFRNKISINDFLILVSELENYMSVYIENRSNSKILFSTPKEIIELSNKKYMTIDIPQLLISCNYDYKLFIDTLNRINWANVKEVHLANIKRDGTRTYVGRSLDDGIINLNDIIPFLKNKLVTLEILGGCNIFDKNIQMINNHN